MNKKNNLHRGFSLIELLVVIAILSLLMGLTIAGVHKVRFAAARAVCTNNLRQLGIAFHSYGSQNSSLPPGNTGTKSTRPLLGWAPHLLPYLEQDAVWKKSIDAFALNKDFRALVHPGATILPILYCPLDTRCAAPVIWSENGDTFHIALTSYLGNQGIDYVILGGVLFLESKITFSDIADGLSNTLLLGERPPTADERFGWWYGGAGMDFGGTLDTVLGVRERNPSGEFHIACGNGPFPFQTRTTGDKCSALQFWSNHSGGSNFLFCDSSVHFISYGADKILQALATRAGGETGIEIP